VFAEKGWVITPIGKEKSGMRRFAYVTFWNNIYALAALAAVFVYIYACTHCGPDWTGRVAVLACMGSLG
jgi:hypothetical protein